MNPLTYLKRELNFKAVEWMSLSDVDKAWYKDAAAQEMQVLGIEVK